MDDEFRCKRIIDGKTYNTETAIRLGHAEAEEAPEEYALFKTRYGAYFLYISSTSDVRVQINPLEPEEAQEWMERYCLPEQIEAEFGEMPEAGDPEARLTIRIPETLRKQLVAIAESRKQSLNAWIAAALNAALAEAKGFK